MSGIAKERELNEREKQEEEFYQFQDREVSPTHGQVVLILHLF